MLIAFALNYAQAQQKKMKQHLKSTTVLKFM
jgi:hypothetical protein